MLVLSLASLLMREPRSVDDRASHVCNCEANVDSCRVFLVAQLQTKILGSTTDEGPSVRGAQMAQPGIFLHFVNRSLRSKPRRAHVCNRSTLNEQIRPNVRATAGDICSCRANPRAVQVSKCLRYRCELCGVGRLEICEAVDRDVRR